MLHDLRFALRDWRKRPLLMCTSVLLLAAGLGGSIAAFSVLYQLVLKPLPYRNPEQLVFIHNRFPKGQVPVAGVSGFDYAEVRRHRDAFANAGVFFWNDLVMTGMGEARHIDVVNASSSLFDVLGTKPELGRVFDRLSDRRGAPGVALLSDAFWHDAFGADRRVIGRVIYLNGLAYTVLGVMPRGFAFPSRETQVWIPIDLPPNEYTIAGGRLEKWLHMVARLAPGVDQRKAHVALAAISAQLAARYPAFYPANNGWRFAMRQVADEQTERIRRWLYLALGAVFAVLLAACITVGGLMVVRTTARSGDIAVRRAMGASNLRVISQILTEVGLVTIFGCGAGVVFSLWALKLVNAYGPIAEPVVLQREALVFAVALALLTTVLAGVLPAQVAVRAPVDQALRNSGSRATNTGAGVRKRIVAAQIAFAVSLIFIATQLNRSFLNLTRVPLGFDQHRVWTGAVTLSNNNTYTTGQGWNTQFFEPLLADLRSIPGVQSASGSNCVPFNPNGVWTEALRIPGRVDMNPHPEAQICLAFPDYFNTLGIPLLKGRTFTAADRAGSAPVAVIDGELARRYFPGEEPVGRLISVGGATTMARIVGVVGTVHNSDLGGPTAPEIYYPELQERTADMYLTLRLAGDVDPTSSVRQAIAKHNPSAALYDVRFMETRVASSFRLRHFVDLLLNGLATAGFVLGLAGLYGSLACMVELRQREIGIRAVLGATRSGLVLLIVADACTVLTSGIAVGFVTAILVSHIIRSQLFGTSVADPAVWLTVLGAVGVLVLGSSFIPAWRAAQIEPATALRSE